MAMPTHRCKIKKVGDKMKNCIRIENKCYLCYFNLCYNNVQIFSYSNFILFMSYLIHQGKFRERANRTSRYQQSENRQAQLDQRQYTPTQKTVKEHQSTAVCNSSKSN